MLETIANRNNKIDESLAEAKANMQLVITESKGVTVLTSSDVNKASLYIKKFSEFAKQSEKMRKQLVQPLNDEVKEINNKFKFLVAEMSQEEQRLSKELLSYQARQREVLAKEMAIERKRQEEEILNKAIADGKEEIPIIVEEIREIPKLSNKNEFGITTMRQKKWRVINIDLVPREFLTVDEAKVKAVRMSYDYEAKSPIAGIEFILEESIRR